MVLWKALEATHEIVVPFYEILNKPLHISCQIAPLKVKTRTLLEVASGRIPWSDTSFHDRRSKPDHHILDPGSILDPTWVHSLSCVYSRSCRMEPIHDPGSIRDPTLIFLEFFLCAYILQSWPYICSILFPSLINCFTSLESISRAAGLHSMKPIHLPTLTMMKSG